MVELFKQEMESYVKMLEFSLSGSLVRSKIIFILIDGEYTISQIQKELEKRKEKYNYRTIWQHINSLEKMGIVTTKKKEHQSGKPVFVKLSDSFPKDKLFGEDYKDIVFIKNLLKEYKSFKTV